ncbi:alanine racemase [Caldinitratiruptor microaerophilus]|uniref:alanine racemase n=1 Tax=Caldinitratiruptor microaerophilus TaxID=671077 RepID=UPI0029F49276|nr:alanine racemase [Caldinitratiruptor microaerophilus]
MTRAPGLETLRPTRALIDLDAIAHNVRELRRHLRPGTALMAVVKADGYGHGAVPVAREALAAGAEWLGVATVEEGIQLRQAGLTAPVLVLGPVLPEQAGQVVDHDLRVAVYDPRLARALDAVARGSGRPARVHVKVETGMGRIGVRPEDVEPFARLVAGLPGVEVEGVFTHFAAADDPDPAYTREQIARFEDALAALGNAGVRPRLRHAANSAAILAHPRAHYDLVRAGIALYGLAPDAARSWPADLRPAMRLVSRIVHLKTMAPGEHVSYGATWTARGGERVATVPVGYADGYRRLFSNRGAMLVAGQPCPVVGRVCMDQTMIRIPPGVPAEVGDEVVLMGPGLTADDWAELLGTINYEVVCLIGRRVPRVYLRGSEVVEVGPPSVALPPAK